MNTVSKSKPLAVLAALLFGLSMASHAVVAQARGQRSSWVAFAHALPPLQGGKLAVDLVEVAYGPGAASPPHTHPCPVIVYVLKGSIRSQVKGQPEAIYRAGQSFYEAPHGEHLIAANASSTRPAKFLAFFVCDQAAPLSAPIPGEAK